MELEQNHIIIGLGGTGGNVIKIFRQQVVDKYGEIDGVDALKNIEFLYVDSNPSEFEEEKWEYQGKNIKLQGNSALVLKAGVLKEKLNDYSSRPEFLGKDSEWGDVLNDTELAKKAGNQMRRLGRVNLIPNIKEIVNRVAQKENNLSSNKRATTLIHIIAGLAGGTGSGSVVDVTAHLLKYFEKRSSDVKLNLYVKLPEVQVPQGWGGQYTGPLRGVSFYQINGYAALKEINGLASGEFEPYDITEKRQRIKTGNRLQAAYLIAERNQNGIGFSDVLAPIASLLFLKTITSDTEKDDKSTLSLPQILTKVDNAENNTINPSTYWGLAGKYRVPGIYKIGVPKVQIRESFAYLLVLNAFNKLLYKNYDEVGGAGYLGHPAQTNEVQREKNQIITNLRSALLDEWFLTYDYLILDEPMIDKNNKLLTEGRDDYSFKVAYKKEYGKNYTLLSTTKQYRGKFIEEKETLKYLQIAINDFFNKDYKGVGYERYYSNMQNNLAQIAEFIAYRIKEKMFGREGGKISRTYPLESYIDLLSSIIQEYFDALERDLKNKQSEYTKQVERKQLELKTINEEYISSFGIFGSGKKREKAIGNFNEALEKFWFYTINLKGITFAIQLIHSHLKNKLLDIKKEIEEDIKKIADRRNKLNQEYEEEKQRLGGSKEIKGFKSITNDEGLGRFQTALMKEKNTFNDVMSRLENLIFENIDKVFKSTDFLKNKDLPVMKLAYKEIDDLLSEKNFRELLKEDDKFYNAHVVEVLYDKFDKDANNPKLRDLFTDMNNYSAPLATINSPEGKGGITTHNEKIVVLPQLQGVKQAETEILSFYEDLKKVIKSTINAEIKEIKDDKFKNEISIAQFFWPIRPDQLDNIEELKKEYDELKKMSQINFLMHSEEASKLVDLIPPKSPDEYKSILLPYLMILSVVDNGFEHYGDGRFWKVSQSVSTNAMESQSSVHDEERIEILLESNNIEDFLKLDFRTLDQRNTSDTVGGFLHPFVYTAIRKKAEGYLSDKNISETILQKTQGFLDNYLEKVKNDSSNENYKRFKNAYLSIQKITNN